MFRRGEGVAGDSNMVMSVAVVLILLALGIGGALGWLLARRGIGAAEVERAALREKLSAALTDLGNTTIRADDLARRIADVERARAEAESALAGLTARHETATAAHEREVAALKEAAIGSRADQAATLAERDERLRALAERLETADAERSRLASDLKGLTAEAEANRRSFERELTALKEAREALKAEFSQVGGELLKTTQAEFLKRADDRFKQSETASGEALKGLMKPVHERLATYEEAVRKVEADRQAAYGDLKGVIGEMRVGQERVQAEAARLVNSLRNAPKARGRWGEQQLKNVLELCGLSEHVDFQTEVSVNTEDGRLRPDAIIRVPGGQTLVIDAKVSLNAYQDAFGADDEDIRKTYLQAHSASMKNHVTSLGSKAYQNQFEKSPDFVIMFVPGEHFVSAAHESDPMLWEYASKNNVLIATPTSLIALAKSVALFWRQEMMHEKANEVGLLGKELFERIGVAADHLKAVGANLGKAVGSYNKLTNSFESRLLTTGRRFEALNVDTAGRTLPDLTPLETLPAHADAAE